MTYNAPARVGPGRAGVCRRRPGGFGGPEAGPPTPASIAARISVGFNYLCADRAGPIVRAC